MTIRETATLPLSAPAARLINAYWRAANYLSVGQIYLLGNALLREPLTLRHVKPRLLGHWGTTPGLNFIYVHLNRLIKNRDLNMIYLAGPGHGGPGVVANTYLKAGLSYKNKNEQSQTFSTTKIHEIARNQPESGLASC